MWCDHPFSQGNKTTKRVVFGWGLETTGKGGGVTKFDKKGARQYRESS